MYCPSLKHLLYVAAGGVVATSQLVHAQDTSFAGMQKRGAIAMGVDQYTSVHRFDDLADGGRIELRRDHDDSAGTLTIRGHLRDIARAFENADFRTPAFVHLTAVPGTALMAAKRAVIRYDVSELPRGGALRITTTDSAAVHAVHEFLAFQRGEHRAPGHDLHSHP